jgi:hypothetical protein
MRDKFYFLEVGHPVQGEIDIETRFDEGRVLLAMRGKRNGISLSLSDGELHHLVNFLKEVDAILTPTE